jgi:hypothetical protein
MGAAVADALAALHAQGRVHGDVRPGAVLLDPHGAARLSAPRALAPPDPGFVAPEVLRGGAPSQRADQWALAATCATALGDAAVPSPLAVVLSVASADDPADRFASAGALGDALLRACPPEPVAFGRSAPNAPTAPERVAARTPRRATPPVTRRFGPRPPRVRPERRAPGPLPVAALALLAVVVGAAVPRIARGAPPAPLASVARASAGCATPAAQPGDRPIPPCAVQRGDLLVTTIAGRERAYRLGRPGDAVLLGDWDGDGVVTPGLYRPSSGEAVEFASWEPGPEGAAPVVALQLSPGGTPSVVHTGEGDRITAV